MNRSTLTGRGTRRAHHRAGSSYEQARAARIVGPQQVEVCSHGVQEPEAGEVRVQLLGCGVCASDLPVWQGRPWFDYPRPPGSPGHEAWGVVDAIGRDVTGFRVGDRVATLSYHSYADFDVMPATSLARLPEDWGEDPFPAEPLACAWNVFQRCQIQSGQTVAIVGIGFLGALLTQLAASSGARVLAISRRAFARNVAAACGADYVFSLEDPEATVRNIGNTLGDDGCDCVIEATGSQSALDVASQLVRIRGRLVIAGYHQDGLRQINLQQWNWKGIDVINAHERDPAIYLEGMRHAMNAVAKGTLDPAPLLTHHYALDELSSAFRDSIERPSGFMKAVVWTRQE